MLGVSLDRVQRHGRGNRAPLTRARARHVALPNHTQHWQKALLHRHGDHALRLLKVGPVELPVEPGMTERFPSQRGGQSILERSHQVDGHHPALAGAARQFGPKGGVDHGMHDGTSISGCPIDDVLDLLCVAYGGDGDHRHMVVGELSEDGVHDLFAAGARAAGDDIDGESGLYHRFPPS